MPKEKFAPTEYSQGCVEGFDAFRRYMKFHLSLIGGEWYGYYDRRRVEELLESAECEDVLISFLKHKPKTEHDYAPADTQVSVEENV